MCYNTRKMMQVLTNNSDEDAKINPRGCPICMICDDAWRRVGWMRSRRQKHVDRVLHVILHAVTRFPSPDGSGITATPTFSVIHNHVATFVRGPHSYHHWRRRWAGQGVSYTSRAVGVGIHRVRRYSLFYASRGANVVVNDVSQAASQKVVDEITKGA